MTTEAVCNLLLHTQSAVPETQLYAETACLILLPIRTVAGGSRIIGIVTAGGHFSQMVVMEGSKRSQISLT